MAEGVLQDTYVLAEPPALQAELSLKVNLGFLG